ncbi:hypothetical protein [Priestia aryabhattai]|uniref:hypothetical protein n=1 Tax=Priestia aryabhattai TaxID=412384 RepID=UPI003D298D3F
MEKDTKYIKGCTINFWKEDENTIHLSVQNPNEGKKAFITSIEHSDKHDGKQRKRTHDNIFRDRKEILEANGKWN